MSWEKVRRVVAENRRQEWANEPAVMKFIRAVDIFAGKVKDDEGRESSISGTGALGTYSTAAYRGYSAYRRALEQGRNAGLSEQETRIFAAGLFLQGSDLFYPISGFERSDFIGRGGTDEEDKAKAQKLEADIQTAEIDAALAFSLESQPGDVKKMKGDLDWHKQPELQPTLADVHRRAFELLVKANSGATSSTEVRCRVVDKAFFQIQGVQRDRRRGYQNMWIGSLREGATLCTSPSFNGAFEATRKYDKPDALEKGAMGLVNVCGAETYRFSQFSPFPQEEEWVVPPGSEYQVLVAERGTENMLAFFTRIEGAIHVDRTLGDARRICLKGVQVLKRQHREATGYAVERFAATTHDVLLVPKSVALGS